jgi:glycosyltransferase involved in cell wall biosynthesis
MKIIFNCSTSGIGPNGGSRTIVRSSNILYDMGHEVIIWNTKKVPSYTWDEVKVPILTNINNVSSDVIIATAYGDVKSTIRAPDKNGLKAHWIRGYETWQYSEDWIKENVLNQPTLKIVNSICLQDKLKEYNIDSEVIRPGYDFNELKPLDIRQNKQGITLGGLFNKGDKRKTKRVEWIFEVIRKLKKDMEICLVMFGADGSPDVNDPFDVFISNPVYERKNDVYNSCDIWLAPTENDSLHNPPAEAMLTECCVVGTDTPMNGMKDYLIGMETGLISKNTINDFESTVRFAIDKPKLRLELGIAGREKILSLGTREYNMNILINYIEDNMS